MGLRHKLERFADGISNEIYKNCVFYGSKASVLTGPVIDQSSIFPDLNNIAFQDNANEAIHRFIK